MLVKKFQEKPNLKIKLLNRRAKVRLTVFKALEHTTGELIVVRF